jgi:hypothetical protein
MPFIMRKLSFICFLFISILFVGCTKKDNVLEFNYTFTAGTENWQSLFSDYPVGEENFYELEFTNAFLPPPLDQNIKSLKISGNNHSDDLVSVIFHRFENLQINKAYSITFNIDFASNTPIGAVGVGGDPNLFIGVGGLNYLPKNNIDNLNTYRPNFISKIQSGQSNEVFQIIGNIGVSTTIPTPYTIINRNNIGNPITIKSNSEGQIWLMIAIDSGFEATTTLYYKSINIKFE